MRLDPETKMLNESVINGLTSSDNMMSKEAREGVDDFMRMRLREDGFMRRILKPIKVTPSDFDRSETTAKPVIIKDVEPNSAGAYMIPFATTVKDTYIRAGRYKIMFNRLATYRYTADVNNLLTYDMDIRQIFNDYLVKDLMDKEDSTFMDSCNAVLGAVNTPSTVLGSCPWVTVGPLSRSALAHSMKGMASSNRHLSPSVNLVNNVTVWDVAALDWNEVGGSLAEDMFVNGFAERQIMGLKWYTTLKHDLVPDNQMYTFAEPKYFGDFFILDDVTISTKTEDFMFEFFGYECIGSAIGNVAGVTKVSFEGTPMDWRTGH